MQLPAKDIRPAWFLATWLLLNLLQAAFSPLDADETYYWMYASQLDWGYFDHPPAVAVLVALGRDWLPGALGLRFGHVLANTALMVGMWHLLDKPRGPLLWLATALVFAQPFLNVYGFIATPDGPLLLFTVLYLLAYRRFLARPDVVNGAIWGLTMAGLLYSKYHGLMLIFFTVLPHLFWLLRQPGAWVAALGGVALYLPHLYWQYANDFPSFRYHLSGRDDAYEIKFTIEYVLNQLVIFSPLLVYHYVLTFKNDGDRGDRFAKACRWLVVGFGVFFLYTTTKGGTEAQWTALLSIPLVYLTFRAARDRFYSWKPQLFRLSLITIGLLTVVRLLLVAPREWLPFDKPFDHQPWTEALAERADGLPVMVQNSYRFASLYEFYAGQPAWTFTDVEYRRNQYDLWGDDSLYHNQTIYLLAQRSWKTEHGESFQHRPLKMIVGVVDSFQVIKDVRFTPVVPPPDVLVRGEVIDLRMDAEIPRPLRPQASEVLPFDLYAIFHSADGKIDYWRLPLKQDHLIPAGRQRLTYEGEFRVPTRLEPGKYQLEIGFSYAGIPPLRGMSEKFDVVIESGGK
jgi:hypothetical protein